MQHIYFDQILFLIFQCFIVAFILLTLFRLRTVFGLSLLLTTLGVFQYMQVFLANALYFEIFEGIYVSSGSSVLFTGSLFAILLVYIKEDTQEARKLIYAILSANIVLIILQASISLNFEGDHVLNIYNLRKEILTQSFRISGSGTLLLFLDTFLIIFIYELVSKYTKFLFLRILITTISILTIDSIAFAFIGFYGTGQMQRIILSGLVSKSIAALIYTVIFTIYLKYNEKSGLLIGSHENAFKDIFHSLTFRQKYDEISAKSIKQEIALKKSEQKYKYFVEQTSEGFYKMECEKPISIYLPIAEQIELMYQYLYIKECNDTFSQMRGDKNRQDVIGTKLKELQGGKNEKINVAALSKFIENNYKTIDTKTIGLDKNNKEHHYLNNTVGIIENGMLTSFWGTQRDITDKINSDSKLIIEKNKAQNYLNVAGVILLSMDANGLVQLINPKGCEILGYTEAEILGKNWVDNFIPKIHRNKIKEISNLVYKGEIEQVKYFENEILTKDGDERLIAWNNVLILDDEGNITSTLSSGEDITERNKIEKALKINEEKYRTLFECAPEGILISNAEGYFSDSNTAICKMLGLTHKELIGLHISNILIPDEIKDIEPALEAIRLTNQYSRVSQFKRKDASIFSAEVSVTTMPDGNLLALVKDITERKELQTALLKEKTQLKAIIDNIPVMITMYDPDINLLFLNNEFERKLDISTKEAEKQDIMELFYPDEKIRKQVADFMIKAPNEWKEFPITSKSGEIVNSEWTNIKLKNGVQIGIGIDITEKKKNQEELNKTKEVLLSTLENMTDGFVSLDLNWNYNYVNKKAGEIFGRTPQNLVNKNIWKEFPEGIDQPFHKNYYKALETQKPIIFEDYYAPWNQWFENRIIPSKNGLAIFFQNITERKISEKKLIEYNNRLKILHSIDSAILNATSSKQICDDVLVELKKVVPFGHASVAEYYKNTDSFKFINVNTIVPDVKIPTDFVPASQFDFINKEILFKGENQIIEDLRNNKIKSKNVNKIVENGLNSLIMFPLISENKMVGTLSVFSDSMDLFTDNNIQIIREISNQLAIVIQQNALKNEVLEYTEDLEEKISERTSQLEFSNNQLKDFAQIVSHDLKAPLRAISQLSYWVSEDYSDKIDTQGQEHLAMLISRVKRMDDLIEGVLQYSRAGIAREKEVPINLETIVNGVVTSLNPPNNFTITIENSLPQILGDPTRFGQLFQNLINNSIKFNDKPKGIITIGCKEVKGYWQFYVSDNGPGIEEKYFERIFQIFQRLESRDNQEGTGVGLTLVKRILQIYGGKIWIESTIGKGTTFYFTLPINK